jgi:hypothetical protein
LPRRRATAPPDPQRREPAAFDALAFKRRTQEELLAATAGMTREEERSFYQQRARTGSLGAWWAQIEAQGRAGPMNGERDGTRPASDDTASTAGAGGSPGSLVPETVARLLDRMQAAIGELGYEAVAEDLVSDDLIDGDDSLLASDEVMVIPGHKDDDSRPILLAVTRGWSGKGALSFTRVMRQVKARLTAGAGAIRYVVVFCDAWDTPAFEEEHREELEAHARQGVRFSFVMVGVPNRVLGPVPVDLDHASP